MADHVRAQEPVPLSAAVFQARQAAFVRESRPLREQMAHLHAQWTRYAFADEATGTTIVCVWTSTEAESLYHALGTLLDSMQQAYGAATP
jgi:hypothetical protein